MLAWLWKPFFMIVKWNNDDKEMQDENLIIQSEREWNRKNKNKQSESNEDEIDWE